MILNADALEIMAYLKTASGKFFSLSEISRRAAGKRRFEEAPNWAKNLMPTLLEAGLVEVNARGHYRIQGQGNSKNPPAAKAGLPPTRKPRGKIIGDDYFPSAAASGTSGPKVVGGDYFPSSD
jgi:hypothetical protein